MMRPVADAFSKDRTEHVVLPDGVVEPLHEPRDESIIDPAGERIRHLARPRLLGMVRRHCLPRLD
jgi:hypothetical protein